jgi:ribosomal protein S18 acetylase RimI-like enzyme
MASPEPNLTVEPEVRPLRQDDARRVGMLVADYFAELGSRPTMSVEQTEQLFATPWLEGGAGLVLEFGSEIAGYGFARPTRWKGTDSIQLGLTLKRGYRDPETYHFLTDPLLEIASELATKHEINNISIHFRGTDTVHPPVMLQLGFQEHPVSMLGFRHDLGDIPVRPLPPEFAFHPARLPEDKPVMLNLSASVFDDRDRQGEPITGTYLDFVAGKSTYHTDQVLLVEDAGDPIGYIVVDTTTHGGGGCYNILELGVLPRSRNLGLGSALVCRVLGGLKARGARAALTAMFSNNLAATLFWRLGFRPDPQRTFRFFVRDAAAPQTNH